jgi:hypothetical protein
VFSADSKGSVTSSQEICGYISVMATLRLTYFLIEGIVYFFKNNHATSLIGGGYFI